MGGNLPGKQMSQEECHSCRERSAIVSDFWETMKVRDDMVGSWSGKNGKIWHGEFWSTWMTDFCNSRRRNSSCTLCLLKYLNVHGSRPSQ